MKTAIIDLGTNTFHLLIVEITPSNQYQKIFQTKTPVRLGEGGINNNYIFPSAIERGLDALKQFQTFIQEYQTTKTIAFATSAIREASNGKDFIEQVKQATSIEIQTISGDREAELIYYGVREAVKMNDTTSLIIDIGGGSTEFIIANKDGILWKQSFLLGASRLIEKFKPSDPITTNELQNIESYFTNQLQPLFEAVKKYPITELIGSSGSFDSLAEMIANKYYTSEILDNKTEYTFNLKDCQEIHTSIIASTRNERLQMKGLIEMRVDMIVISDILVHFILNQLNIPKMRLSTYSLKEGVLWELIKKA